MQVKAGNLPLVSIALATYNGREYLRQQLDSLLAQTYGNLEIVVSDDNSTDDTLSVLNVYKSLHPFLHVYTNGTSPGIKNNFEHALRHCKGEFIALCDQDDVWMPEKITALVNEIGDADMVYHDSLLVNEKGESLYTSIAGLYRCYSGKDPRYLMLENCISGHACMFRASLLQQALPLPAARFHDWWLAIVAASGNGIRFIPNQFVHYRQHTNAKTDILRRRKDYRPAGAEKKYMQELEWYERCASLAGPQQSFFIKWLKYYRNSKTQWLSFPLCFMVFRNRHRFFYIRKKSSLQQCIAALTFLPGLPFKKILLRATGRASSA